MRYSIQAERQGKVIDNSDFGDMSSASWYEKGGANATPQQERIKQQIHKLNQSQVDELGKRGIKGRADKSRMGIFMCLTLLLLKKQGKGLWTGLNQGCPKALKLRQSMR